MLINESKKERSNMWTWHWFLGLHLGFEWYETTREGEVYEYFILDILCLRIQHCNIIDIEGELE